ERRLLRSRRVDRPRSGGEGHERSDERDLRIEHAVAPARGRRLRAERRQSAPGRRRHHRLRDQVRLVIMSLRHRASSLVAPLALPACSASTGAPLESTQSTAQAASTDSPPLNKAWAIATHNSYWVKRSDVVEAEASGTQERLVDQLLFDHVRALEIDIHQDS